MTKDIYYNYASHFLSDSAGKAVSIDQELSYKDQLTWNIHLVDVPERKISAGQLQFF